MRKFLQILASLALAATCASPAAARGGSVPADAALVFAVGVSSPMDGGEQKLQLEGYVGALTSPEIFNALANGVQGRIAAVYMEWAAGTDQKVVVPWTPIDSGRN